MQTEFPCPHCGQTLAAAVRTVGKKIKCPACAASLVVPGGGRMVPMPAPEPWGSVLLNLWTILMVFPLSLLAISFLVEQVAHGGAGNAAAIGELVTAIAATRVVFLCLAGHSRRLRALVAGGVTVVFLGIVTAIVLSKH